jgi:hypothetical protein
MMDNLATSIYFPTAVYSVEKPDFIKNVMPVFDEAVNNVKQSITLDELHPVYMTGNLFLHDSLIDFSAYVAATGRNILVSQGYKMDNQMALFESMWGQEHYKTSGMDQHIHGNGVQLTGFYFLDCPENCSKITIYDPRAGKVQYNLPEADSNVVSYASSAVSFAPKDGLLVYLNPWLPHAFTRHGSDKPFKFIHFNLFVAPVQEPIII